MQASKGEQFTVKQLMKTRKAIKTKLEKLNDTKRKDTVIDFEQLGVDRLFIDESHFYKNLYLSQDGNIGGIAQTEAPEIKRPLCEVPLFGRNLGQPWHGFRNGYRLLSNVATVLELKAHFRRHELPSQDEVCQVL